MHRRVIPGMEIAEIYLRVFASNYGESFKFK
jgi:hypothetical protein